MLFGQGLASSSLALQPSHLCNPSLTDLGPVPKNIFLLRAHYRSWSGSWLQILACQPGLLAWTNSPGPAELSVGRILEFTYVNTERFAFSRIFNW